MRTLCSYWKGVQADLCLYIGFIRALAKNITILIFGCKRSIDFYI